MKDLIKDLGKKRLLIILGALVGVFILITIILLLYNAFKTNSYASVEEKILNAAKAYYNDNSKLLPKNVNDEVSINSTTLVAGDHLEADENGQMVKASGETKYIYIGEYVDNGHKLAQIKIGE